MGPPRRNRVKHINRLNASPAKDVKLATDLGEPILVARMRRTFAINRGPSAQNNSNPSSVTIPSNF